MWYVIRDMWYVIRDMWYVIRDIWYVSECCSVHIYRRKTSDLIFKVIQQNLYFKIIIIIIIVIIMSLVTDLFFLVILLNQQWFPPLRFQASHCSTFRIVCDVPSTAVFCSESIKCFPDTASKFFLKLIIIIIIIIITILDCLMLRIKVLKN
jgi:hypothetical protein